MSNSSNPTFADSTASNASPLRAQITAAYRRPEPEAMPPLLDAARMEPATAKAANELAKQIATRLRNRRKSGGRAGLVQGLLQEYALSSQEGVALMCLAEALLRIPDSATRDALIRDKIANGQWQAHAGRSSSVFVNAATWGLLLTGKLVATHSEAGLSRTLTRLIGKGGEPLIRKGVDMAMRMMGEQFVTGETIGEALANSRELEAEGFRYSYDMLGEAALTEHDAQRYRKSYEAAIHAIGKASAGRGVIDGPGISIKLSALHPRYFRAQRDRVMTELYPVLLELTLLARQYDIGLNIDAEEADRLELSLDLLERLCHEPGLAGWHGIGFVIQAYQKRCPYVIDFVIDLARRSGHRLMVRLVKGAYWDSEIKRAQVDGLDGYPVFTRKAYTDVSYLACARKLLEAPDAVYPQFATHNAHSLAAIYQMADPARWQPGQYEFQCLHGMGEPLYEQVVGPVEDGKLGRPCRIYAPVGTHETLLAYLVRRLLENGANTSFVNRIADRTISIDELVRDPIDTVTQLARREGKAGLPHPSIPLPVKLYGKSRANSAGIDLANEQRLAELDRQLAEDATRQWQAGPLLAAGGETADDDSSWQPALNPSDPADQVGRVREARADEVESALAAAEGFAAEWAATSPASRAKALDAAAAELEAAQPRLIGLLMREAGKTAANAIAEVREAVDFLRFYAQQARSELTPDNHQPLGPVVCISPWNFPLAIFTGQVAAALAAGNTVLAKPAEQTPLVAAEAVRVLHAAGVPRAALQLLPGRGETVGAQLVGDARTMGVMFTGSTEVARILQRSVAGRVDKAGRAITLIAETGGQNAMIVDSSALVEQVVQDILASAFDSAGQRCSALRVLCLQREAADRVIEMLRGAMAELRMGNPGRLSTDVGPVIDAEAKANIVNHIEAMRQKGRRVLQLCHDKSAAADGGYFVAPTLIELNSIAELQREVFGPVLHVVRYERDELEALIDRINATGYGLTLGVHTRIDETIGRVCAMGHCGNIYVNRNMVGAVVGVQPFGGEGLSGTGPKAGGPLYLYRLLSRRPDEAVAEVMTTSDEADDAAPSAKPGMAKAGGASTISPTLRALQQWASRNGRDTLAETCKRFAKASRVGVMRSLPGPTGEHNLYTLLPRNAVLCLTEADLQASESPGADADDQADDRLVQLAAVLAVGSRAVWPAAAENLAEQLPLAVQEVVAIAQDWTFANVEFDAALLHGSEAALRSACQRLAEREGPIVTLQRLAPGDADIALERLLIERSLSVNTAAAGGNASLMAVG
ncbi:trifunctional transcriptional regulator/proline dehydrogenase/L-glutamate gamma-semialdehyde dehydrogenase [Piscinibacter sakaiensis]|uniref:trifunctional transcriptional regulator/proline dehydrogenase/L-glutamate gamma-semialdehyde dehydrogenase n=1 Tax=Piscinibacter sakaiensis TaxID=1547922 RepID=UPI003AAFA85D